MQKESMPLYARVDKKLYDKVEALSQRLEIPKRKVVELLLMEGLNGGIKNLKLATKQSDR